MNIGDRVRVLHGQEEGIITKIIDSKTVEIEITEGFTFPVLISDLVRITDHEDRYFRDEQIEKTTVAPKELHADKGVFLALQLMADNKKYQIHIINNTDLDIVCTISRKEGKLRYAGIFRGLITKRKESLISTFGSESLSSYNELYCQILYFDSSPGALRIPVERQIRMAGLLAANKNERAPVLDEPAWLKQLDDQDEIQRDREDISEKEVNLKDTPQSLVDLHAEAIGIEDKGYSPNEILEEQIKVFNESLDRALIFELDEITFIHGVGQGTLKNRIIKEIKNRKGIRYWEDALKEKFGHGAIKIVL